MMVDAILKAAKSQDHISFLDGEERYEVITGITADKINQPEDSKEVEWYIFIPKSGEVIECPEATSLKETLSFLSTRPIVALRVEHLEGTTHQITKYYIN